MRDRKGDIRHSMDPESKVSHVCIGQCHSDPRRRQGELSPMPAEGMRTLPEGRDIRGPRGLNFMSGT